MKLFNFLLLLFILISCENYKKEKTKIGPKTIKTQSIHRSTPSALINNEKARELNNDAIALGKNGYTKESKLKLIKALAMEPNSATILNNLGICYSNLLENKKAIRYFLLAIKNSDSTNFLAKTNLSGSYYNIGSYENAIEVANDILKNCEIRILLINTNVNKTQTLIAQHKCNEAKITFDNYKKLCNENDNLDVLTKDLSEKLKNCK